MEVRIAARKTGLGVCLIALLLQLSGAVSAQQLPTADAAALLQMTRVCTDIEDAIMLATGSSLDEAAKQLVQAQSLPDANRRALAEILRGVRLILQQDSSQPFQVTTTMDGADRKYVTALAILMDASRGSLSPLRVESQVCALNELAVMLTYFRMRPKDDREPVLQAVKHFQDLGGVSVVSLLVEGSIHLERENPEAALLSFAHAIAMDPDSWRAAYGYARAALRLSRPADAYAALLPLAGRRGSDPTFAAMMGTALYQMNRLADARPWLEEVRKSSRQTPDVMLMRAHVAVQERDFLTAGSLLNALYRERTKDRTWLVLKSVLAQESGRLRDAERYARIAVQLYPTDAWSIGRLIEVGKASGDVMLHKEVADLAEKLLAMPLPSGALPIETALADQAHRAALAFLVLEYYRQGRWSAAADLCLQHEGLGLDKAMVAEILRRSGNLSEALAFTRDWMAGEPSSEKAAEAYLRTVAAMTGGGIAKAEAPLRDVPIPQGLLALPLQPVPMDNPLIELVVRFLAMPFSKDMRSFLLVFRASLEPDEDKAIGYLREALLARADNPEAFLKLATLYTARHERRADLTDRTDRDRALLYLDQVRLLAPSDPEMMQAADALRARLMD